MLRDIFKIKIYEKIICCYSLDALLETGNLIIIDDIITTLVNLFQLAGLNKKLCELAMIMKYLVTSVYS